jgi:hypothetical protein
MTFSLKNTGETMNQGNECDCAPEMREIKGVWVPSHEEGCIRNMVDSSFPEPLAAGRFMSVFEAYRSKQGKGEK